MNSKGESVKNRDIIEYLALLLDSRERWGQTVTFEHVKGHSGDVGNDGADRLAVQGAWKEEEADWDFKKQMEEFKALFEKQLQEREAKRKSKKPRVSFSFCLYTFLFTLLFLLHILESLFSDFYFPDFIYFFILSSRTSGKP